MLDKLRRQFILIIMALVTAALAIMAGVIIFMNYQQLSNDAMSAVEYATTAFAFEDRGDFRHAPQTEEQALQEGDTAMAGSDKLQSGKKDDKRFKGERQERTAGADIVATSVYLVDNGKVSDTLMDALELDSDVAEGAVAEVSSLYEEVSIDAISGYLDSYGLYYSMRQSPSGLKVAFASNAYVTNSIGNLALVLGIVSVCVWLAFLLVSILLARWVVRPTQRAWAQQQQFVADASHELKTPLAVMMANNSILLSHQDDTIGSQVRWVESNQDEARQMLDLVNDMLFLAQPQSSERQVVKQDVDLSSLVERSALQFEAVCFERGVVLDAEVAPGVKLQGDPARIQRLVSTLVDNACKYADASVKVSLVQEAGRAKLAISNDGATIPAEDLPHVFDRFYRVDKARVRSEGGVGLGLAIAQEVAHEQGGSITVESSEAAGTTFTVVLPC